MRTCRLRSLKWIGPILLVALATPTPVRAQAFVLSGLGPVNRSMAGAGTAAPLDAIGAIHWNPASITGLERSEIEFGVELLYGPTELSSAVAIGPFSLSGTTESENGANVLPAFGLVYKPDDSCWTFGVGLFVIGGFGVNYPGDNFNPVLSAPPPNGLGAGPIYSRLQVLQIAPTVAYQVNRHLSIGFAPTVSMAELLVDPLTFAAPDDANGDGFPTFPSATHSRLHWGGGFQAGVYCSSDAGWHFGASFKSPQWFEKFRWQSADEVGRPRFIEFDADYPMILSLGVAYTGFERVVVAADLRYLDFENTDGFRTAGFDATGALTGLGWDSILFVALGVQYQWSECCWLRAGYSYNPNPVPDAVTSLNVASPTIYEHIASVGASYQLTDALKVSVAYAHAFENSISGPIVTPFGPLPGTSVTSKLSADALVLGVSVRF